MRNAPENNYPRNSVFWLYGNQPSRCLQRVKLGAPIPQAQSAAIRAVLVRELARATRVAASASMELNAITRNFPGGIPPPEAAQTFQHALHALNVARDVMIKAQTR